jgi:(2Fe-2S) ferredoxin
MIQAIYSSPHLSIKIDNHSRIVANIQKASIDAKRLNNLLRIFGLNRQSVLWILVILMGVFRGSATMANAQYRVFVCTKKRPADDPEGCCHDCGAMEVLAAFEQAIAEQQLGDRVKVKPAGCLDHCKSGAVAMVFQPKRWELGWLPKKVQTKIQKKFGNNRIFYGKLRPEDVPNLVQQHFGRNQILERFKI